MKVDSPRCLAGIAWTMRSSAIWVATPPSGLLRGTVTATPGTGTCITAVQMSPGPAAISSTVYRFVAFGIDY